MAESPHHAQLSCVVAHRGASAHAPENTLSAITLAAEHGARCVELDVSISVDGIAFVHHDHALDRCTNGTGLLCEHTAAELDELTVAKPFAGFDNEPIPRLSHALIQLAELSLGLNLEIKPYPGLEQRTVESISRDLYTHWSSDQPLVISSFNDSTLGHAQALISDIPRALLVEEIKPNWINQLQRLGCSNLHCNADHLSQTIAKDILASDHGLYCYTVNDVKEASRLLSWGVHGIFTDDPLLMLTQLDP